MVGCFQALSRRRLAPARLAGASSLVLLLLLFGLFSPARPAHASGGDIFVQTATAANTAGDSTMLDDPLLNNNPNAVISVTANWNPYGGASTGFDNHQVGVWYDSWEGRWGIFNEDGTSMPVGAAFNVDGTSPFSPFVQTATPANTSGYISYLNAAGLNDNPSASLWVTQNWDPGGQGGVYNPHAVGVWYNPWIGQWSVYNEDRSSIPMGASFNIFYESRQANSTIVVATASNTFGDSVCITNWSIATYPEFSFFITHVYNGYFTDVAAVWYNVRLNVWCIFDGSFNSMPLGTTFIVGWA
jgi:hypothetical protein